ncbi:alpha/beta fold hydrolase [Streptomyces chartreusis]|uniref:alpha/beta fold hydrolase n=1 Tax=Streptomyces chartreusis TaxID=1969 RepID=UPI00368C336C
MLRIDKASALLALCTTVTAAVLVGCAETSDADSASSNGKSASAEEQKTDQVVFSGTKKIDVVGHMVNVSCVGSAVDGKPVIVLLSGGGDNLTRLAGIQKSLSKHYRVCSFDRLGQGASDKPDGPQTIESTGEVLTGVIDHVAGDSPVVLAGHSLGGLISARYAPGHQDRIKGLVLMDATAPTQLADLKKGIPESATGPAVDLREQTLAILQGQGPEKLKISDGEVRSAGDIPVEVIQHGQKYLEQIPEYGPELEKAWAEGQRKWLELSERSKLSTATSSGHYIYEDQPEVAFEAIQRVAEQAADRAQG